MTQRIQLQPYSYSLNFAATTDKVDCGADFVGTGDVSLSFWVKPTTKLALNAYVFDNGKFKVFYATTNRTLNVRSDGTTNVVTPTAAINKATWAHFVVTRTSGGTVKVFKDGVLLLNSIFSGIPATATNNAIIGNTTGSLGAIGHLKNMRFYNRILSNDEVTNLYYLNQSPSDETTSLVRKFLLEEGSGTTITSTTGHTGTITGATWSTDVPRAERNTATSRTTPVTFTSPLAKAKVTIVFDDGGESVATIGYPYMSNLGIVGTVGVNSAFINTAGYMTTAQTSALYADGWSMVNHTENHLNLTGETIAVALSEYVDCRDWLISNGFSDGAEHVIFPENATNALINKTFIENGAKSLAGTTQEIARTPAPLKYIYPRFSMSGQTTADFTEQIDSAIAENQYIQIYYHFLRDPGVYGATSTLPADFEEQMDYLKTKIDAGLIDAVNFVDAYNAFFSDVPSPRVTVRDNGTSLNFNGSSNYVSANGIPSTLFSDNTLGTFTLSAWVKTKGVTQTVMSFGNNPDNSSFVSLRLSSAGVAEFVTRNTASQQDDAISSIKINDDEWRLLTAVKTDSSLFIYADGQMIAQEKTLSGGTYTFNRFTVGALNRTSLSSYFKGLIDEPRIWNRALTATEIQNLYLYDAVPRNGLVGEYLFDEGAGTTALDTSGNGNDGVISGCTYTTDVPLQLRDAV